MKVSEEFDKFLRAENVKNPIARTINSTSVQLLGEERERNLIVHFAEPGPSLVAKPMRRAQLVALFGDDTDDWVGQRVELYTAMVSFGRETVPSIQVRAPQEKAAAGKPTTPKKKAAQAAQAPLDDALDGDGIPF